MKGNTSKFYKGYNKTGLAAQDKYRKIVMEPNATVVRQKMRQVSSKNLDQWLAQSDQKITSDFHTSKTSFF